MSLRINKIIVFIGSIIIIGFGIYFYQKFKRQEEVQQKGKIVSGKIVHIGTKNNSLSRTYKVKFGTTVDYLDWGPKEWDNLEVGDEVKVRFLEGNSEIIQPNMNPTFAKYFSAFWIVVGVLLAVISIIHKPKKKNITIETLDWLENKEINKKTLDNYFGLVFMHRTIDVNEKSKQRISKKILEIYDSDEKQFRLYLEKSLNRTDWKVPFIYKAMLSNDNISSDIFLTEFERIVYRYKELPIKYHERILKDFLYSEIRKQKVTQISTNEILRKKLGDKLYQKINTST